MIGVRAGGGRKQVDGMVLFFHGSVLQPLA
jgi:hypothetical protein